MFSTIFEERDKKISLLVKLGDCLGRSLRENVTLFSIDGQNNKVTYLTENDKVISGDYAIGKDVVLNGIVVQDSSVYKDNEVFDKFVNEKINYFVENIHHDEYSSADDAFSDILSLWDNRLKLDSVQAKLHQKATRLAENHKIVASDEFQRLVELKPQLVEFLKEHIEKISTVPEIKNAVNLSETVSNAFNFPRLSYDELQEGQSYILKDGISSSIYEMICQQELVKKELLESKKEFDVIWANTPVIQKLASMIFEGDDKIVGTLAAALKEVPFLALASKKSLFNTFNNCLAQADGIGVSEKDIQKYASNIFEIKKESKEMLINMINEEYGVNVQNLQEPVSFKSLINTQVVIFEALSRLAPKGSVLKEVLSENAVFLKAKNGVESIDVNDFIRDIFSEANYTGAIEEGTTKGETRKTARKAYEKTNKYMAKPKPNLKKIAGDLSDMGDVIDSLQSTIKANADQEYPSDENVDQKALAAQEMGEQPAGAVTPTVNEVPPETDDADGEPAPVDQKELLGDLTDLETMVADLAAELGVKDKSPKEKEAIEAEEQKEEPEK